MVDRRRTADDFDEALRRLPERRQVLHLYICAGAPRCESALLNVARACEKHLPGRHEIRVYDLLETPSIAKEHNIVVVPTLVRVAPLPMRRIVGDLSDEGSLLQFLEINISSGDR